MTVLIGSADYATNDWLTQMLYEPSSLHSGRVIRVRSAANTAYHSQTTRLEVTYAGIGHDAPPTQLFLKILGEHKGKNEVNVYRQLKEATPYPPMLAPCYAAEYEESSGVSNLLLADVSDTHREASSREEVRAFTASPPLWQVEAMVDTIARWHARWWGFGGTEQLPADVLDIFIDESSYQGYAGYCRNAWRRFAEVEPALASEYAPLYEPLVERMPQLWQGYLASRLGDMFNLTLVHGDCYFSQFLYPLTSHDAPMILIDFDSVRLDLPTDDLMFLLATFWNREARQEHEKAMLRRYHAALHAAGVNTYPWEFLLEDYRFSIVQHAMYPILGWLNGDDESFWRLRLRAITQTYRDWNCTDFVNRTSNDV